MKWRRGCRVEASSTEEGYGGAWFECTVLGRAPGKDCWRLRYDKFVTEEDGEPLVETLSSALIRPVPPPRTIPDPLCVGDAVEAYDRECWWRGLIVKIQLFGDLLLHLVYFPDTRTLRAYPRAELRLGLEWIGRRWIHSLQEREPVINDFPLAIAELEVPSLLNASQLDVQQINSEDCQAEQRALQLLSGSEIEQTNHVMQDFPSEGQGLATVGSQVTNKQPRNTGTKSSRLEIRDYNEESQLESEARVSTSRTLEEIAAAERNQPPSNVQLRTLRPHISKDKRCVLEVKMHVSQQSSETGLKNLFDVKDGTSEGNKLKFVIKNGRTKQGCLTGDAQGRSPRVMKSVARPGNGDSFLADKSNVSRFSRENKMLLARNSNNNSTAERKMLPEEDSRSHSPGKRKMLPEEDLRGCNPGKRKDLPEEDLKFHRPAKIKTLQELEQFYKQCNQSDLHPSVVKMEEVDLASVPESSKRREKTVELDQRKLLIVAHQCELNAYKKVLNILVKKGLNNQRLSLLESTAFVLNITPQEQQEMYRIFQMKVQGIIESS